MQNFRCGTKKCGCGNLMEVSHPGFFTCSMCNKWHYIRPILNNPLTSWINRIKNDKALFRYLANKIYKFFNVIERNDKIISKHPIDPKEPKIFRIIDMYDSGALDVVCDEDPSPMRQRIYRSDYVLYAKFFRGSEHLRSATYDNGWRAIGGVLANIRTGEVLKVGKGSEGMSQAVS